VSGAGSSLFAFFSSALACHIPGLDKDMRERPLAGQTYALADSIRVRKRQAILPGIHDEPFPP
jgi:hypothetical protein